MYSGVYMYMLFMNMYVPLLLVLYDMFVAVRLLLLLLLLLGCCDDPLGQWCSAAELGGTM